MPLQINLNPNASANGGLGVGLMTSSGNPWTVADQLAQDLVNRGLATALNWPSTNQQPFSNSEVSQIRGVVSGARVADSSSRPITAADNGARLAPTGALTYTIPDGLSPMPSFSVDCPASGIVTIARSGAATLNGAGTSLTRTRASNPVGFVVLAHVDTDSYGVSGA